MTLSVCCGLQPEPTARIDYVLLGGGLQPTKAWVPGGKTESDHLPVVVEVQY